MYYLKNKQECFSDLKHEAIAECFRSYRARTASFLNDFKHESINMLIREESLKITVMFSNSIKFKEKSKA